MHVLAKSRVPPNSCFFLFWFWVWWKGVREGGQERERGRHGGEERRRSIMGVVERYTLDAQSRVGERGD